MTTTGSAYVLRLLFLAVLAPSLVARNVVSTDPEDETSLPQTGTFPKQNSNHSDDAVRADPLNGFKKYQGSYDITNKNYWSSTIFTGIYGYAIGILWLMLGAAYGGFLFLESVCRGRRRKVVKSQSSLWPFVLATLLLLLSIIACCFVLQGNAMFRSRERVILDAIIGTAEAASETLYNTTRAMKQMRDTLELSNETAVVRTKIDIASASYFLFSTSEKFDADGEELRRQTRKNRHFIDKALKIAYVTTTAAISLTLAAAVSLSACGVLRLRQAMNWIIALCWILATLCWIFFGIYYCLYQFSKDSCTALGSFQRNPYRNSLSSILPCDKLLSAQPALSYVGEWIFNLVNKVNAELSASYPDLVFRLCNPFSGPPLYQYQPEACSMNTIKIGEIPEVLKYFTCSTSDSKPCNGNGSPSLSPTEFNTVKTCTSSIQGLLEVYPAMRSLLECQLVKDTFAEIVGEDCKPLIRYAHKVWVFMAVLSTVFTALVLFWTVRIRHDQLYDCSDGSVIPHLVLVVDPKGRNCPACHEPSEQGLQGSLG